VTEAVSRRCANQSGSVLAAAGPRRYAVRAITAGAGNGLRYPAQVLADAVASQRFEGAAVYLDHSQMGELWSQSGGRSVRNVLGVLEGARMEGDAVAAELRLYPGPEADRLSGLVDQWLADRSEGRARPPIGLSAVMEVRVDGEEVRVIEKVESVDVVVDPARGGEFVRALNQEGGVPVERAEHKRADWSGSGQATTLDLATVAGANGASAVDQAAVALSEQVLGLRLAASGLPEPLREMVRDEFSGKALDVKVLESRLEALQTAWARSTAAQPGFSGVGLRLDGDEGRTGARPRSSIRGVINEQDRLEALMMQICGLRPSSEALQGLRPVSGIRELYLMLSGDYDFRGVFEPERVALANVTTGTMTSLVKNVFNKVILDYFNTVERWWDPIVITEQFLSMKDLTLITLGGFVDLPTVSEGGPYTELSWSDAEETVAFTKKGGYVGVTLEMMDKDETRAFRAIPRKLAIAGYRTLSTMISDLWTANSGVGAYWPSSQSTYRLFDASYGNLGNTALSAEAWDAAIQAMYKQSEATSNKRMGIRPAYLVVPIELEKTALTILLSEGEPGTGDNDANVRKGSSRIVVCPNMTDANDWLAVADPRVWPSITVGYRFSPVPEVFIAGEETVGSMFTNDEMRIKARYVVAVGAGDYRPLYKSNVA